MEYPYPTLWINGRDVLISDITSQKETPKDLFEKHTFSFIRAWLGPANSFELQTSGSTGDPKIIIASRDQLTTSAQLTEKALGLKRSDVALVCLDPSYIAGKMMLVRCFVTGMQIRATTPSNVLPDNLQDHIIHFAAMVPAQVFEICRSPKIERLRRFKTIIIGGAPLDDETKVILQTLSCRFVETYGMTETFSHIALRDLNGAGKSDDYTCLPEIRIRTDERGCLQVEAPHLQGVISTNDLVEISGPTTFRWLGRADHVINSGGIKIIPEHLEQEITNVLRAVKIYSNVLLTGVPDSKLGQKVVLIVESSPLSAAQEQEVMKKLSALLSKYEMPKQFFYLPNFTFTGNGKINRMKTVEMLQNITRSSV